MTLSYIVCVLVEQSGVTSHSCDLVDRFIDNVPQLRPIHHVSLSLRLGLAWNHSSRLHWLCLQVQSKDWTEPDEDCSELENRWTYYYQDYNHAPVFILMLHGIAIVTTVQPSVIHIGDINIYLDVFPPLSQSFQSHVFFFNMRQICSDSCSICFLFYATHP